MAGTTALPIVNDQFTEENVSEFGKFTIQGTFDAATSCKGSLYFPKGFSVFGAVLSKDVTIAWTAFPK